MNERGKTVKKIADVLAIVLIVMIFGGILSATGLLSGLIPGGAIQNVYETSTFNAQDISELDIEVASANITFAEGDSLSIEALINSFNIKEKGQKIIIEEKGSFLKINKNRDITIYIPKDFTFKKVQLETGASYLYGDVLNTEYLETDIGAGVVELEKLNVTKKAEIDCGAGQLSLKSGSISSLDFSLGVGSADITAELKSNADIESGVGELKLNLTDSKESYCFDIETGLGSIIYDGATVKGDTLLGNGDTKVSLEGGVGSVEISFAE